MLPGSSQTVIQAIEFFADHLHPEPSRERLLMMLKLFLDDGGSQTDPNPDGIFAIGGYVAPASAWKEFVSKWQAVLDEEWWPLPSKPYHATDCEPRANGFGRGDYRHWTNDRLVRLRERLAPLTLITSAGVGRGVILSDFEAELARDPIFKQRFQYIHKYWPISFCLETALDWLANEWPDRPEGEVIAVTFEAGTYQHGQMMSTYNKLRERVPWAKERLARRFAIGTKEDQELQAADMLAYESFRAIEGHTRKPPSDERPSFTALKNRLSVKWPNRKDYAPIREMVREWLAENPKDEKEEA